MKFAKFCGLFVFALSLFGCISPKSYVDPSYQVISYSDLKRSSSPMSLNLVVDFQRNGEPYPRANTTLLDNSSRILRATGLVNPNGPNSVGNIKITLNNIADTGTSVAKGFGTGLTFGLVGSTVTDSYELTISITTAGKTVTKSGIKHSIHTAIGNTSLPTGVEPLTPGTAFPRVLEQMLLRGLKDIQNDGFVFSGNLKQEIFFPRDILIVSRLH